MNFMVKCLNFGFMNLSFKTHLVIQLCYSPIQFKNTHLHDNIQWNWLIWRKEYKFPCWFKNWKKPTSNENIRQNKKLDFVPSPFCCQNPREARSRSRIFLISLVYVCICVCVFHASWPNEKRHRPEIWYI